MVYIVSLTIFTKVFLPHRIQIVSWKVDETPTITFPEYSNFLDVISLELVAELSKHIEINEYTINLINNKQSPYQLMYSLNSIWLETLKMYMELNLVYNYIKTSKSPIDAPILFVQKLQVSFCLCVHYQDLNNQTIKNKYPLPLINQFLN